jgi:hypothetical protein
VKIKMHNFRYIKILLITALIAFVGLGIITSAQSSTGTTTVGTFCSGTSASGTSSGGVIPSTNILSGQSNGVQSLITVSVFIMLVMLMIVALVYMISYVTGIASLMNFVKAEIGEIILTGIIIAIFIGGFSAASAATTTVHIAGVSVGQQTFVDDCTYLSDASLNLFVPYVFLNVMNWLIDVPESLTVKIEPSYFGLQTSPLNGYNLFDTSLSILENVTGAFMILIIITIGTLGLIYGLFPIFLYAGIVLRTLPWTRAAGGAFLGLFIGFYIVFPLLLHVMLAGYASTVTAPNSNPTVNTVQSIIQGVSSNSQSGGTAVLNSVISLFTTIGGIYGGQWGLINGYIYFVIEPAAFTTIAIIISFVISFDFAELAGDLLGAPSLNADSLMSRIQKI